MTPSSIALARFKITGRRRPRYAAMLPPPSGVSAAAAAPLPLLSSGGGSGGATVTLAGVALSSGRVSHSGGPRRANYDFD